MPHFVANRLALLPTLAMLRAMLDAQMQSLSFRVWLQSEFSQRTRVNSQFSLRAFARLLDMDASTVSQLLSGKRIASGRMISKICDKLAARPEVRMKLLSGKSKASAKEAIKFNQITIDAFSVIADWYHYAILELSLTEDFESSPHWIAKKLGIGPTEAVVALERLERLELLENHHGRYRKTAVNLTNGPEGFSAPALKELQRQLLQKALTAIDAVPQDEKDITSMTMSIDPTKLPEARKRIKKFRRDLCAFLEDGPRRVVYNLGIQLFPLSQNKSGDKNA